MLLITEKDIIKHEGYAEIEIKNSKNEIFGLAKIDLDRVNDFIGLNVAGIPQGYAIITNQKIKTGMHRFIVNAQDGDIVDHINGDRLDNRSENLRIVTQSQNFMNKCKQRNNKSGHRGILWYTHCPTPKWAAYITVNKKRKHLGYFDDIEEAIKVREAAEKELHGEFSPTDERWNQKRYKNYNPE